MNFLQKCRLCLFDMFKMEDIFEGQIIGVPYIEIIFSLFNIHVTKEDKLSKSICYNCISFLNYVQSTKLEFITNQEKALLTANNSEEATKNKQELMEQQQEDETQQLIKVSLQDLEKISDCVKVSISKDDQNLALTTALKDDKNKFSKHFEPIITRRNNKEKLTLKTIKRQNKYRDYYYKKATNGLRELIRAKSLQSHSKSLLDLNDSFKITRERAGDTYVLETWSSSFCEDFLNVNYSERCKYCDRMFKRVRKLRLHEHEHERLQEKIRARNGTLTADNGWFTRTKVLKKKRRKSVPFNYQAPPSIEN